MVKTILYHLDEAEELLDPAQDVEQVEWVCCTSSQLLSAVEALYGPQEGGTSNAVGMRVKKYQDKLASSYGISYEYRRNKSKREHVFTRELI